MSINSGRELRAAFIEYFSSHRTHPHPVVASAPLVPPDDPTLMFTSAGMVQFKALYSGGVEPLPYVRATTVQKCLRAGGKGSDLENVGRTLRHHTFFEMLGNFSFGDYFKREAIRFAWEFLTSPHWMALPKERLFATIYGPTPGEIDREAEDCWQAEADGLCNPIVYLDATENFWGPAGGTGACGPCSEIKFFMGNDDELAHARRQPLDVISKRIVDEGDTFFEIWNLVFPQFDQQRDGSRPALKYRGIDTGAGLERMTTAMLFAHGVDIASQYETDLLRPIVDAVAGAVGVPFNRATSPEKRASVSAIADHARALVFCLAEGITPSNIGRGYVVRRIQRRALRFAALLGKDEPFMEHLYDGVVEAVGDAYPEIKANPAFIRKALCIEEETFLRTRERGEKMLNELITQAKDSGTNRITGEQAFRLLDTYGYPIDLTREVAEDAGVAVDEAGYEAARADQKREARKSWKGAASAGLESLEAVREEHGATEFIGHSWRPAPAEARVLAILQDGVIAQEVREGEEVQVVLDRTPFYAESGGQVGDTGTLAPPNARLVVLDTQKTADGLFLHRARVEAGGLAAGDMVEAIVDVDRRQAIMRHHSATHLLQNALKRIVGSHITQAGSFVGPTSLRFDFTHTEPVTAGQLRELQEAANELILSDFQTQTDVLPIEEARRRGALAPFGEKYGAVVRVVTMGPSIEFCGGTHLEHTSQAGALRIVGESSIASGVRRIEGVVGSAAVAMGLEDQYDVLGPLHVLMAARGGEIVDRVKALSNRSRELERDISALRRELAVKSIGDVAETARVLPDGTKLVAMRLDGFDGGELRAVAESLRSKLGPQSIAILGGVQDGKVALVVAVGTGAVAKYQAGKIVNAIATPLGGKGGGKHDMAQAGAKDVAQLDVVLARAHELIV